MQPPVEASHVAEHLEGGQEQECGKAERGIDWEEVEEGKSAGMPGKWVSELEIATGSFTHCQQSIQHNDHFRCSCS